MTYEYPLTPPPPGGQYYAAPRVSPALPATTVRVSVWIWMSPEVRWIG
jgi:hypothetical protein